MKFVQTKGMKLNTRAEIVTFDYRNSISICYHYCMKPFNTKKQIQLLKTIFMQEYKNFVASFIT